MQNRLARTACLCVALLTWCRSAPAVVVAPVQIIDLGIPPGGTQSFGTAMNNPGVVAVRTGTQPFLRSATGVYTPAGLPGGFGFGQFNRINAAGIAVGYVATSSSGFDSERAAIRSAAGVYTLPLPSQRSRATGINDSNAVAGHTIGPDASFVFRPGVGLSNLPNPPGGNGFRAMAINNGGTVVGTSAVPQGGGISFGRATRHDPPTGSRLLPTFNGAPSEANDVNDAGVAIGSVGGAGTAVSAAKWLPDDSVIPLSSPDDVSLPTGLAISSNSDGVGVASGGPLGTVAMYWPGDTGIGIDLNKLLSAADRQKWVLTWASDINDQGQIVGWGRYTSAPASPETHGFLINLVPEPTWLAATSVLLMQLGRRRKHRQEVLLRSRVK